MDTLDESETEDVNQANAASTNDEHIDIIVSLRNLEMDVNITEAVTNSTNVIDGTDYLEPVESSNNTPNGGLKPWKRKSEIRKYKKIPTIPSTNPVTASPSPTHVCIL